MAQAITDDYGWQEEAPDSCGYLNPSIVKILKPLNVRHVLDAGCGNGALAANLVREGYAVVGMDGDAGGIEHARRNYPGIEFFVGNFADAPPPSSASDARFDAVVSTEVVEHLYAPHELPRYAFDALRPGGCFVISTPYHGYLKNLAISLVDGWDAHHTVDWHGGHIKFWSRRTLTRLLEDSGFQVVDFEGSGRLPYLWKSMILVARKPT